MHSTKYDQPYRMLIADNDQQNRNSVAIKVECDKRR